VKQAMLGMEKAGEKLQALIHGLFEKVGFPWLPTLLTKYPFSY